VADSEAEDIIEQYNDGQGKSVLQVKEQITYRSSITIPGEPLNERHRRYIEGRGFDPDHLTSEYGILGTGPMEYWEGEDCQLRIIIPLHDLHGRIVAWQGRDITNKQEHRYKFPSVEKCLMHYKETLYGAHLATSRRIVVVEGIFDAWRMGRGFACSYGTSMTNAQIRLLSNWDEIIFLFDPEPEAQAKALSYARELAACGRSASVVEADFGLNAKGEPRDCGDLTEKEAEELRLDLY
jgi:DNA primase